MSETLLAQLQAASEPPLDQFDTPTAPTAIYISKPLPDYVSSDDYHEGLKQIRAHLGRDCGFGIVIEKSKTYTSAKGEKRLTKIKLGCSKGKEKRGTRKVTGQRHYATRKIGCPYKAKMTKHPGGGWNVAVICPQHTHDLNDELDERGLPPRARRTPAKGRGGTQGAVQFFTPPGQPNPMIHFPRASVASAWSTTTASGYRRVTVPIQQRVLSASRTQFPMDEPMFIVYNDDFNSILGTHADLKIALEWNLPYAYQAGVYDPKVDTVCVTSNQIDNSRGTDKVVVISKLKRCPYGDWTRHQLPSDIKMPSGGVVYNDGMLDGILYCAQGDLQRPGGLVYMESEYPFRVREVLNNYHGRRFNSPKDVAVHPDGSVWFTDPIYGYDQGTRPAPELPNQVYRFNPHTGDVRVMADGFGRPSGICFSQDERVCYISDTDFNHGDGNIDFTRASTIYAYDIEERCQSKFLTNRRVFAMADIGVPDGLRCDTVGNVYTACGDGLSVWSAGGVLLGKVLIPGGLANFCFGKEGELFLLNGTKFWVLKVADTVKGAHRDREVVTMEEPDVVE